MASQDSATSASIRKISLYSSFRSAVIMAQNGAKVVLTGHLTNDAARHFQRGREQSVTIVEQFTQRILSMAEGVILNRRKQRALRENLFTSLCYLRYLL